MDHQLSWVCSGGKKAAEHVGAADYWPILGRRLIYSEAQSACQSRFLQLHFFDAVVVVVFIRRGGAAKQPARASHGACGFFDAVVGRVLPYAYAVYDLAGFN